MPILVGVLGVAGVVTAQVITTFREERRWRREQQREDLRWERQKEERTHEARAEAYAELIGVVEALDFALYRVRKAPKDQVLADDLREVVSKARHALGPVNLHAPERIRVNLKESMLPRFDLAARLLDSREDDLDAWRKGQREYRLLRAEMRRDLGLDAEDLSHLEEKK